jgi:two-component system, OmpR family, sensor kinase
MTVKTRITLFIAGAGFISSLLFSIAVFIEMVEQPFELLDNVLKEEAQRTAKWIAERPSESEGVSPSSVSLTAKSYWIEIHEQDTKKLLFQSDLAKSISLPRVNPGVGAVARVSLPSGQAGPPQGGSRKVPFRIRTFLTASQGRAYIVQIARAVEKLDEEIWDLVIGLVAGLTFSTLVLIAISRFVAGKILHPIGAMKDLALDISEKNLDRRIPAGDGPDEFSELARTINRMLDRLQYSFARQRNLLFDTSHELKTPLSSVRLGIDEICAREGDNLPTLVEQNLARVREQILRMEKLVKDLLNLSSLEALAGIDQKPVEMTGLLSSLAAEYQFLADGRCIKIETRLTGGLTAQGDEEKLRRAFSNILDNAVKYNLEGGTVEVIGEQSAAEVTVAVANTGPGLSDGEIPKVFDQFYRTETSRSTRHGGSGLGLAIVKRIVELHGGKVKFESRQGESTRVTVSLPA